jgi:hypothetical protein
MVVVVSLAFVVVVTLGVAVTLMVILVHPSLHHVVEFHNSLGAVASTIAVEILLDEAVLEAVDDVLVGDVGDGGVCKTSRSRSIPACIETIHGEFLLEAWSPGSC